MSAQTEALAELVNQQDSVLEAWAARRCEQESELDPHLIKAALRGYLLWFAALSDALLGLLAQRRWTSIGGLVDKCITDGVPDARKSPADSSGVPSLLSTVFFLNALLESINMAIGKTSAGKAAEFFQADLAIGLQTAVSLLGSDKAQAIYDDVRETFGMLPYIIGVDLTNGSVDPNVAQPTVPSLELFTGRSLAERKLTRAGDPRRIQLVSDYSGGSALSQVTQTLTLKTDGRFTLEEKTFEAVVGALASEKKRYVSGTWQIVVQNGAPHLRLQAGGRVVASWKSEAGPSGFHFLNGSRWHVSDA
jgi:hypothetical protein